MEQWNDGISFLRLALTRGGSGRDLRAFVTSWRTRRAESFATAQEALQRRPLVRVG